MERISHPPDSVKGRYIFGIRKTKLLQFVHAKIQSVNWNAADKVRIWHLLALLQSEANYESSNQWRVSI